METGDWCSWGWDWLGGASDGRIVVLDRLVQRHWSDACYPADDADRGVVEETGD